MGDVTGAVLLSMFAIGFAGVLGLAAILAGIAVGGAIIGLPAYAIWTAIKRRRTPQGDQT